MGLSCRPSENLRSIFVKMQNQLAKEAEEAKKKKENK